MLLKTFSFFKYVPKLEGPGIQNCVFLVSIEIPTVSVPFTQSQFIKLIDLPFA